MSLPDYLAADYYGGRWSTMAVPRTPVGPTDSDVDAIARHVAETSFAVGPARPSFGRVGVLFYSMLGALASGLWNWA